MVQLTPREIRAKLDELSEIKSAADVTRMDYEAKRAEILKSVQAELEALEAEYAPSLEAVNARIETLEEEIKDAVLHARASVKGTRLQAVYTRGRVRWDTKKLDAYGQTHPEVAAFRSQGNPSVALRVLNFGGNSKAKDTTTK